MIKLTLNWLDLISTEKKTSQTVMIDKDNCVFSVVYSLLKIKSKAHNWKYQFLSDRINHVGKNILMWYNDFAFHISNHVSICQILTWVRKTELVSFTVTKLIII